MVCVVKNWIALVYTDNVDTARYNRKEAETLGELFKSLNRSAYNEKKSLAYRIVIYPKRPKR